jgi:hypothetical protein
VSKLKYKVGDLVTISYERDRIGVITHIRDGTNHFPYTVQWLKESRISRNQSSIGHYSQGVIIGLEDTCK